MAEISATDQNINQEYIYIYIYMYISKWVGSNTVIKTKSNLETKIKDLKSIRQEYPKLIIFI